MTNGTDVLAKLFGSPARVKVMRLFLLNQEHGFESKDIMTRTKIKSGAVRKELSLLSSIDFIKKRPFVKETVVPSKKKNTPPTVTRKKTTGWFLNESFPFLKQIEKLLTDVDFFNHDSLSARFKNAGKIKLLVISGIFIKSNDSRADLLIVGDNLKQSTVYDIIKTIESEIGRELSYAVFPTAEFVYRASMYDKLIYDMFDFPHEVLIDTAKLSTSIVRKS